MKERIALLLIPAIGLLIAVPTTLWRVGADRSAKERAARHQQSNGETAAHAERITTVKKYQDDLAVAIGEWAQPERELKAALDRSNRQLLEEREKNRIALADVERAVRLADSLERRMNGLEKQPLSGSISLQRVVYLNTPNIWGSEGIGGPETAANHRKPVVVDLDIQKEVPAHHKLISIKSSAISLHDSVQTVSQFERLSCDPFEGSKIRFGLSPAAKGTACATVVKIVVSYSYAIESDE